MVWYPNTTADCRFEFEKRREQFVSVHDEPLSIFAMRVSNPDCSPFTING